MLDRLWLSLVDSSQPPELAQQYSEHSVNNTGNSQSVRVRAIARSREDFDQSYVSDLIA